MNLENRVNQLADQHFPQATPLQRMQALKMYKHGLVLYEFKHRRPFWPNPVYNAKQREYAEELTKTYLKMRQSHFYRTEDKE